MADEKIVTPGAPPLALTEKPRYTVEKELDDRAAKAREKFEQSHTELFQPVEPVAPASDIEPATAPTELPAIEPAEAEPAIVEEPAPTPQPVAAEQSPATSPETSAAPPAPAETKKPEEKVDWRMLRQIQRENKKLQKELEALKAGKPVAASAVQPEVVAPAPVTPAPTQPAYDESDPFGAKAAAREEAARVRAELQADFDRQQAETREKQELAQIDQQEKAFLQQHPDYYDAVTHMANYERSRYQRSGMAAVEAGKMMADPQWEAAIERVADNYVFLPDPNRANHLLTAERSKLTPEQMTQAREMTDEDAAICLATERWIQARRQDVLQGARATRRPVPEIVWDIATNDLGWKPRAVTPAANGTTQPPVSTMTTAEKIRQSAKASAAAKSLSAVGTAPSAGGAPPPAIRSLTEWMDFQRKDPAGARQYMNEMSKRDPQWHRNLQP